MPVRIVHPKPNHKAPVPRRFFTTGTADPGIIGVTAELKRADGPTGRVIGSAFEQDAAGRSRWRFLLEVESSQVGQYTLTVTGHDETGPTQDTDTRTVSVGEPATESIVVDYPESNTDLTDEKDYFVAYGTFTDGHEAVSATMNSTPADSLISADGVWSAVFPSLAPLSDPNRYTLLVVDSANHADTKTGLIVH